jgi:hypothetical protein
MLFRRLQQRAVDSLRIDIIPSVLGQQVEVGDFALGYRSGTAGKQKKQETNTQQYDNGTSHDLALFFLTKRTLSQESKKSEWLSKKRQMQGAQLSRNEAYQGTPQ